MSTATTRLPAGCQETPREPCLGGANMPAAAEGPLGPHVDSIIRPGSHMVSCGRGPESASQNGTDPAWRSARLLGPSARGCSVRRSCCVQSVASTGLGLGAPLPVEGGPQAPRLKGQPAASE